MPDAHRLVRLVGDGDASGGGLPLPDAFTAVLQELLDHGPATTSLLTELVLGALSYKNARVMTTWKTWDDFTADILDQLEEAGLVARAADDPYVKWELTGRFTTGRRLVVIPEAGIGVTVRRHAERTRLNTLTAALLNARTLEGQLRQLPDDDRVKPALKQVAALIALLDKETRQYVPAPAAGTRKKGVRGPEPRPTPRELAREKYGLDGMPVSPRIRPHSRFGPDGRRPCVRCGERREPDQFELYWEDHNNGYFLRGACRTCEAGRGANRVRR